ncbi:MAG: hypothetical protein JOS17DRAFT_811952 [Linnemannia elongata]|nr:MAG: hypothetical protein JOS17DRAFT_811952 [Linnemannia elongata]
MFKNVYLVPEILHLLLFLNLHFSSLLLTFTATHIYTQPYNIMGNNTGTKPPSTVTTTIITSDSENGLATLASMLRSVFNRKLAELKMWQYQPQLQAAAAKIEGEIAHYRKEMLAPAAYSE